MTSTKELKKLIKQLENLNDKLINAEIACDAIQTKLGQMRLIKEGLEQERCDILAKLN